MATWNPGDSPVPGERGSEAAFLLERYTAYTMRRRILRRFRIAHAPWRMAEAKITIVRRDLLGDFPVENPSAAHYSPGLRDVHISAPEAMSRGRQ